MDARNLSIRGGRLSVGGTAAEAIGLYLRHWRLLAPLAVLILLPQAVISTFVGDIEIERIETVGDVLKLVTIPLTLLVSLAGEALLAGIVTAVVVQWRAGHRVPGAVQFVRTLLWVRLITVDVLLAIGTVAGMLLLVAPGLAFFTFLGLAPAVIEIERRGVWDALRRSASLVRGSAWRVFLLFIGAILGTEGLAQLLLLVFHGFVPELASELAVDALLESGQALIIALVAISLIELRGDSIPPRARA